MTPYTRRRFLQASTAAAATPLLSALPVHAQNPKILTIAYNVALPSWDPTTGPSAVNPTIQSIYKSVFDSYIDQNPNSDIERDKLDSSGVLASYDILHQAIHPNLRALLQQRGYTDVLIVNTAGRIVYSTEKAADFGIDVTKDTEGDGLVAAVATALGKPAAELGSVAGRRPESNA